MAVTLGGVLKAAPVVAGLFRKKKRKSPAQLAMEQNQQALLGLQTQRAQRSGGIEPGVLAALSKQAGYNLNPRSSPVTSVQPARPAPPSPGMIQGGRFGNLAPLLTPRGGQGQAAPAAQGPTGYDLTEREFSLSPGYQAAYAGQVARMAAAHEAAMAKVRADQSRGVHSRGQSEVALKAKQGQALGQSYRDLMGKEQERRDQFLRLLTAQMNEGFATGERAQDAYGQGAAQMEATRQAEQAREDSQWGRLLQSLSEMGQSSVKPPAGPLDPLPEGYPRLPTSQRRSTGWPDLTQEQDPRWREFDEIPDTIPAPWDVDGDYVSGRVGWPQGAPYRQPGEPPLPSSLWASPLPPPAASSSVDPAAVLRRAWEAGLTGPGFRPGASGSTFTGDEATTDVRSIVSQALAKAFERQRWQILGGG